MAIVRKLTSVRGGGGGGGGGWGGGGGGGGDQVPSAGLHVGGWVIFSPKNTVRTWY